MPIIPQDFVQSAMPTGAEGYQNIQANPNDFGAQMGAAESQLGAQIGATGDMLSKHAIQRQSLINETSTQDVINKQFEPAFRDLYQNYYKLQGKDAEDAFPKFQQDMTNLRDQMRGSLTNPEQQHMFDTYTSQRQNKELDAMARHAATQTTAWVAQTHHAAQDGHVNMGADKWNNPQALDLAQRSIVEEATNFSTKTGSSPEMREMEIRNYTDKLYSTAIARQALTDPVGAKASFQSAVNAGKLSGEIQEKIDQHLKPLVDAQTSRGIANSVLSGSLATGGDKSNNLGNIRASATSFKGYDSPEDGAADAASLLRRKYSGLTLEQIGNKWAPPSENDTAQWVSNVSKASGLDPKATPNLNDPGQLKQLLTGIATAEKSEGELARFTPDVIERGIQAALSGKPPEVKSKPSLNPQVPDVQQIQANYPALEDQVRAKAEAERPGDKVYSDTALSHFRQESSVRIQAQHLNNQANETTVLQALADPNGPKDLTSFLADPARLDAYSQLYKSDPQKVVSLQHALDAKAKMAENPPATTESQQLWYNLLGNAKLNPDEFVGKNMMDYYGQMPLAQWHQLVGVQQAINKHDVLEATKQIDINKAMADLKTELGPAGYTLTPKNDKDKLKLEQFAGRLGESIDQWRQNNNQKRPGPEDILVMGRQLLTQGVDSSAWVGGKMDLAQALTEGKDIGWVASVAKLSPKVKNDMVTAWKSAYGSEPNAGILANWSTMAANPRAIPDADRWQIITSYQGQGVRMPNDTQIAMTYVSQKASQARLKGAASVKQGKPVYEAEDFTDPFALGKNLDKIYHPISKPAKPKDETPWDATTTLDSER